MRLSDLVKHLSYSSLSAARTCPAFWVLKYGHKHYEPTNAAMARGQAVEHGLYLKHNGDEFDDPAAEALKDFNKRTALGVDGDSRAKEAENIPLMLKTYDKLWDSDLPKIEKYQRKIEVELPGVDVPCIGFTDFEFEDAIVDIKTTTRMPSAISSFHRWQGAIYQKAAGNKAVDFIYVTPKKAARYRLENSDADWNAVCQSAQRLQNFLAAFDDLDALTAAVIPNYDSFYWSHPNTREKGRQIFGF